MKKFVTCLAALCLSCVLLTSCGSASWNQERAQTICSQEFETLTPEDFDDMLGLIDAGWEKIKANNDKSSEITDEDREFTALYFKLGGRAESMAYATKRVVSDEQVKEYEALKERLNRELKERTANKNK